MGIVIQVSVKSPEKFSCLSVRDLRVQSVLVSSTKIPSLAPITFKPGSTGTALKQGKGIFCQVVETKSAYAN